MNNANCLNKRIILLTGFMASGKSTYGKRLADYLQYNFVDMDQYIEAKSSLRINDIFTKYGENWFRDFETKCFKEVLNNLKNNIIIAAGGGLPLRNENQVLMNSINTIFIDTDFNVIKERLNNFEKSVRPLIAMRDIDDIKKLYEERKLIYLKTAKYSVKNLDELLSLVKELGI